MSEITVEEFVGIYGSHSVTFHSYYKYSFSYRGKLPNDDTITVFCGDSADSIYRHEVTAGESKTIKELYLDMGISYGYVTNSQGEEVVSCTGGW